jgi:hypothetical protein
MFGGFTKRPNFGNQLFPSRVLGQFGNVSSPIAGNFLSAAGITDPTISVAINQLVIDLSNYGILSKFYAIWPFVGGTSTTCKFNLINPADTDAAFRLNFVGGWTISANGILGNGTNTYANTFFVNTTSFSPTNHSYGVYSRTNSVTGGAAMSAENGGTFYGTTLFLKNTDNNTYWSSFDYVVTGAANFISDTRGLHFVNRITGAEKIYYRNGVNVRQSSTGVVAPTANNIVIGARNLSGQPIQSFDTREYSFAFLSQGFTPTEASNFYTAVQAFQTTLGRQV